MNNSTTMTPKIFIIYSGEQKFSGESHLKNFINYLFSNSKNHSSNENSDKNMIFDPYKSYFLTKYSQKEFEQEFKNELVFNNLKTDLFYFCFAINIENVVYTNILQKDSNNDFFLALPNEIVNYIIENDYKNNIDDFNNDLETYFNSFDTIVSIEELEDLTIRLKIETILNNHLNKKFKANVLLSVSHNDQNSLYHKHRLIF